MDPGIARQTQARANLVIRWRALGNGAGDIEFTFTVQGSEGPDYFDGAPTHARHRARQEAAIDEQAEHAGLL
jgi:hypothetical protein